MRRVLVALSLISVALLGASCNRTSFIVKEYNELVQNAFDGEFTYRAYYYSRYIDTTTGKVVDTCYMEKHLETLNNVVMNPNFDGCKFVVDFDYLEKMKRYVKVNSPSKYDELISINRITFEDTLYYYNMLNIQIIEQ